MLSQFLTPEFLKALYPNLVALAAIVQAICSVLVRWRRRQ